MISNDLREVLIDFSESIISPKEFEEWLASRVHMYASQLDTADSEVVAALELAIAEVSASIKPQSEIKRIVSQMLDKYTVVENYYPTLQYISSYASSSNASSHSDDLKIIEPDFTAEFNH
ncbi:MAG: hypothetical protein M1347_04745 [Chloroflexi bacterium]|nr:hypothetical protein [Chloroflexota bacterium]